MVGCSGGDGDHDPGNASRSDNSDNPGASAGEEHREVLGPTGGTIEAGGAKVAVPAGALDSNVEIVLGRLSDAEAQGLPEATVTQVEQPLTMLGHAYAFTPHGTTFAEPVELSFEVPTGAQVVLRLDDRDDTEWEWVPDAEIGPERVTVHTSHFSVYAAFRVEEDPLEVPGPTHPCDWRCPGTEDIISCNETTAACWKPVEGGLQLPSALGNEYNAFLTRGYSVDLDWPDTAPYAAFVSGGFFNPPQDVTLSFFPLHQDVEQNDVITTEPFTLSTDPAGPAHLIVRGIYDVGAASQGGTDYLVVGQAWPSFYAERPVLLSVDIGAPGQARVREVVPQFSFEGPYGWMYWKDFRGPNVFTARQGTKLHIMAGLREAGSSNHEGYFRFTIPLSGFEEGPSDTLTVRVAHTDDGFPVHDADNGLWLTPMSISAAPGGELVLFAHGHQVTESEAFYRQFLQLWDVDSATKLAEQRLDTLSNPTSTVTAGESNCSSGITAGTTGAALSTVNTDHVNASDDGIEDAQLFFSDGGGFLYATTYAGRALSLTRSACAAVGEAPDFQELLDTPSYGTLLGVNLSISTNGFSSVWSVSAAPSIAGIQTVTSHNPASDQLTTMQAWTPRAALSTFGPLTAIPLPTGQRLFGVAQRIDGLKVYTLDLDNNGAFAQPLAAPEE